MSHIVRAQAHAALKTGDPDKTTAPGFIEGTEALEEEH